MATTAIDRLIALILAAGVVSVMVVALSWKVFELDRYFVPKEFVVNVSALVAAALMLAGRRAIRLGAVDVLFLVFLAWSAVSALFATNHWMAQRALGLSFSSALIFWASRRAGSAGMRRMLLGAGAAAAVVAAATSLAQAYGVENDWFTLARAPGGTLGNRNFVAHVIAIGLPVTIWCTVVARRRITALAGSLAIALLCGALVLSRSRAAWLAVAMFLIVSAVLLLASLRHWRGRAAGGRLARLLLAAVIGGALAVALPNDLDWNSDSPYLDSARKVVDYSSGSGRGRIAQYRNSLDMAIADPVFGAGPGNWAVWYPRFAPRGDKSLLSSGMTANPWPSSDWVAWISERGLVAAVALAGVFVTLFFGALRGWKDEASGDDVLMRVALAGTIVSTLVVSAFDAVLLLPAPAFLVWVILGAASGERRGAREREISRKSWSLGVACVLVISVGTVARSGLMMKSMASVGRGGRTAGWVEGARWDPGSYRINQRVAELYAGRGQCTRARLYARRAIALFPSSPAAKRIGRRCGIRT